MRARLEVILLVLALGAVGAFIVSFALGWRPGARIAPTPADTMSLRPLAPPVASAKAIRVEVLNASGKPGLARVATDKLRDNGFDVVYFGNAAGPARKTSSVIDRVGKLEAAHTVATAIGIASVQSTVDVSRQVDTSVILGSDWPPQKH
jgi:hypothetical protein